jgi:hypothetical protein
MLTVEMVSVAVIIVVSVALMMDLVVVVVVDAGLSGGRRVLNSTAAKTDND